MARRADLRLAATGALILAALFLGACSQEKRTVDAPHVGERAATSDTPGIVPSPAYSYHQLRLASESGTASYSNLGHSKKNELVIWAVNGDPVHTGASLDPSYTSPGDQVTAIVKAADASGTLQEIARYETVVTNSAPRVYEVYLKTAESNPFLFQAVVRADDADGQKVQYGYRWLLNGEYLEDQHGSELLLDKSALGAEVKVEVVARDRDSQSASLLSPAKEVEGPTVFIEIGSDVTVQEMPGEGNREYRFALQHSAGASIDLLDAPPSVSYRSGEIVWRPTGDETRLSIRVRAVAPDGSTAERELRLEL
jgi:hypothetical protein